jgi:hypothetical protein
VLEGNAIVNDGLWHNAVLVLDRNYMTHLYIDGELDSSISSALFGEPALEYLNTGSLRIADEFNGSLDEIFIADNKTLSSDEVQTLYGIATHP